VPRLPQAELPGQYAWGDIFVFPTIEDGYAQVLAQAQVSGLPLLSTVNSGAPDMVTENVTGWLVPIRSPETCLERLRRMDAHRAELAAMVERIAYQFQPRSWDDVAREFERLCESSVAE
jgi:glycosyltransferase involved in cell wall biosynthesis